MQVHVYDIVILFLLPCSSASRVNLAGDNRDKGADQGRFVPIVKLPGELKGRFAVSGYKAPAVRVPQAMALWKRLHARLHAQQEPDESLGKQQKLTDMDLDRAYSRGFQVFTEFNDTLFSSGNDLEDYYKGEMYPGGLQFVLELSRGTYERTDPSSVVAFSSRPEDLKAKMGIIKDRSRIAKNIKRVAEENDLPKWALDMEQPGSRDIDSLILSSRNVMVGVQKWTRYKQWKNDANGKPFVFVGQDESVMQQIALEAGPRLQAAFVHDVILTPKGIQTIGSKTNPIYLFDTYYDAATKAYELGLISWSGMKRVEHAFAKSSIVQMCDNKEMFGDERYPCFNKEKNIFVDSVTFEPLSAELQLDLDDGTADFPECTMDGLPMVTPLIVGPGSGTRCTSIARVVDIIDEKFHG